MSTLSKSDQAALQHHLKEVQQCNWTALSMDKKKAAYYVVFGPHGPQTLVSPPREGLKVLLSTLGLVGVVGLIAWGVHAWGGSWCAVWLVCVDLGFFFVVPPPPKMLTGEWQEASNNRTHEQNLDPITGVSSPLSFFCARPLTSPSGISSEGYKGKGFVQN